MKCYNVKPKIIHCQKRENEREIELFSFVLVGTRFLIPTKRHVLINR